MSPRYSVAATSLMTSTLMSISKAGCRRQQCSLWTAQSLPLLSGFGDSNMQQPEKHQITYIIDILSCRWLVLWLFWIQTVGVLL